MFAELPPNETRRTQKRRRASGDRWDHTRVPGANSAISTEFSVNDGLPVNALVSSVTCRSTLVIASGRQLCFVTWRVGREQLRDFFRQHVEFVQYSRKHQLERVRNSPEIDWSEGLHSNQFSAIIHQFFSSASLLFIENYHHCIALFSSLRQIIRHLHFEYCVRIS